VLCRIDVRRDGDRTVVHLAGHLTEAQVPDLLAACAGADTGRRIVLALDELVSADSVGIDALLRIEQLGVELMNLPEYLRIELDGLTRRQGA
jgi:anti-anti-sigma regulatory factor